MSQAPRSLEPYDSALAFFGSRLRELRTRRGLSQDGLASRVHVSGDLLSKIERALRRPSPNLVESLDTALEAHGDLIALAPTIQNDELGAPAESLVAAIRPDGPSGVGAELVAGLSAVLAGLRQMDHSLGSGTVLASVLAQAQLAEGLLSASAGSVRSSLLAVLAETYQLAGWIQFDQAQAAAADLSFRRAREFAVQADDAELIAFVLGPSHGFAATYSGNPQLGLRLAEQATESAERSGNRRLTAFTLAIQARALARLGEVDPCQRQLDAAAEQLARHDDPGGDPVWLGVFDDAALRGHRGSCELDLRRPAQAVASLSEQHDAAPAAFVRNRTIWLLDRADAQVALGEPVAACGDVGLAWQTVAGTSSRRTMRRFDSTVAGLNRWHDVPEVAETLELLRA